MLSAWVSLSWSPTSTCIDSSDTCHLQGSIWELVQRTQAHSRFAELYKMPAYEDGWQRKR